jgi:small subunit ribosomal protein S6
MFARAFRGPKGFAPDEMRDRNERPTRMPLYEHVYLARQDVTAQQVETLTDSFKSIIEAAGGTIEKVEYWGVKKLAFRIKKNRKAHFSLLNISAPAAAVAEMERQMGINEDILRFMTIRVEALEEGPSAMMQKRDRDDERGDRGDRFGGGGGRFGGGGGRFGDRDRGPRPDRGPPRRESAPVAAEESF